MFNQFKIKGQKVLRLLFLGSALLAPILAAISINAVRRVAPVGNALENSAITSPTASTLNAKTPTPQQLATEWVVSPAQAKQLIQQGATLLDARGTNWQKQPGLQGALAVSWQQFNQKETSNQGKLLEDEVVLTQKLRDVGVFNDKPVVVVGNPINGWGEEGRIVWMLRTLGHRQAVLVDGGYQALVEAGVPTVWRVPRTSPTPGDFTIHRTAAWEMGRDELRSALETRDWLIIDVRESREFNGKTPYGEQRRGHIPGTLHLHYRELLDANGNILPREAILAKLQERGVSPDAQIVAYCTAGVRAGFFTSVMTNLGFNVKNYAGSMLDWSAAPALTHPMTTSSRVETSPQ